MAKAYWVTCYREVRDKDRLAAYAKLAGPAIDAAGGRFLIRGVPSVVYESGVAERTVVIEFDSLAQATGAYQSSAYQSALAVLGDGAVRDIRFVPGV